MQTEYWLHEKETTMIQAWIFRLQRAWMVALDALTFPVLRLGRRLCAPVYFGRSLAGVPTGSLVVFPLQATFLGCGIAGIVAFKRQAAAPETLPVAPLAALAERIRAHHFEACRTSGARLADTY